jgi:large subunit ribosomal protein L17
MRHSKVVNHLGRTSSHRKAMLANMAISLIIHKRITTTIAKAKALRTYVEPLITKSKDDSTNSRRVVFSYLEDKKAVTELFREISPKIGERPGGYTRILKTGARMGDNADMCIIELVDYNEAMLAGSEATKAKATRRRRSTKKTATAAEAPKTQKAEKATKVAEVVPEVEEVIAEIEAEATTETVAEETAAEVEEVVDEITEEAVEEKTEEKAG